MNACIIDFCGSTNPGHFTVSFWADWDGERVVFGGDWSDVPSMQTATEPTREEVVAHVEKITGRRMGL